MYWRWIDSGYLDAYMNMAVDEAIALAVREGRVPPTLRFYQWDTTSVSIGQFQKTDEVNLDFCQQRAIPVVRRPTGGRGILHGRDLTYSFAAPVTLEIFSRGLLSTYHVLSNAFFRAFVSLGIPVQMKTRKEKGRTLTGSPLCFQSVSYGEITLYGKKVMGSAQKRWNEAFLQQGTLLLEIDENLHRKVFLKTDTDLRTSMIGLKEAYPAIDTGEIKRAVLKSFSEVFHVEVMQGELTAEELREAERLCQQKYSSKGWLLKR